MTDETHYWGDGHDHGNAPDLPDGEHTRTDNVRDVTDSEKSTADREALASALHQWRHPCGEPPVDVDYEAVDALFASGVIQPANLHAAKVLRDAASQLRGAAFLAGGAGQWLRARADRIEAGE